MHTVTVTETVPTCFRREHQEHWLVLELVTHDVFQARLPNASRAFIARKVQNFESIVWPE